VFTADCVVIGAGVIGLAAARALALRGLGVVILERQAGFGTQISSRNSEVVHAGIHYRPGSLKAESCVAGRRLLQDYCRSRGIEHRACGKFIVAADPAQVARLEDLERTARRNGVCDLEWLEAREAVRREPALACAAALHSPSTGIIDSHAYMLALLGDAEAHGAVIAYRTRVTGVACGGGGIVIEVDGSPALRCRSVVNAAGLDAVRVAASFRDFPSAGLPVLRYAKGSYFSLAGAAPFSRLIYPMPEPGGLGVHMTLDLAGQARFGPDVEWIDDVDYEVREDRAARFYPAIRSYWPGLADGALRAAYAGIRPKLTGPGEPDADFIIAGPADHGVPGVIHLFGIESPGLTASLDLAQRISVAAVG
jgi:L-2-hydroxyglutarate oxidase LhgO